MTTTSPLYQRWAVTTNTVFSAMGDHTVSFTARFDYERVSNPVFGHVIVTRGARSRPDADPRDPGGGRHGRSGARRQLRVPRAYAYSVYLDRFKDAGGLQPSRLDRAT